MGQNQRALERGSWARLLAKYEAAVQMGAGDDVPKTLVANPGVLEQYVSFFGVSLLVHDFTDELVESCAGNRVLLVDFICDRPF